VWNKIVPKWARMVRKSTYARTVCVFRKIAYSRASCGRMNGNWTEPNSMTGYRAADSMLQPTSGSANIKPYIVYSVASAPALQSRHRGWEWRKPTQPANHEADDDHDQDGDAQRPMD
jgi:hypothetical protein